MSDLTDLQICKRIAEIDGEKVAGVGDENVYIKCQPSLVGNVQYNPLTDDALCFQLMIKYHIDFLNPSKFVTKYGALESGNASKVCVGDESPNKAICRAIIEAHDK